MEEFTGQLIGGPDDGNLVTSSVATFPVVSITELWLDGVGEGKQASVVTVKGWYTWLPVPEYFVWKLESNTISTKEVVTI